MTEQGPRAATWDWLSPSAERSARRPSTWRSCRKSSDARKRETGGTNNGALSRFASSFCDTRGTTSTVQRSVQVLHSSAGSILTWSGSTCTGSMSTTSCFLRDDEIYNKAIEVRTAFDLNIKEEKTRSDWIGPKGRLQEVLENSRRSNPDPG